MPSSLHIVFTKYFHFLQELKKKLKGASGTLYPLKADVSKEEDVATAFKWVKDNLGGVDVLINNAGVASYSSLSGTFRMCYAILTK